MDRAMDFAVEEAFNRLTKQSGGSLSGSQTMDVLKKAKIVDGHNIPEMALFPIMAKLGNSITYSHFNTILQALSTISGKSPDSLKMMFLDSQKNSFLDKLKKLFSCAG